VLAAWLGTAIAPAQRRVDERNLGERLILIVPVVPGAGTAQNPARPLYVPTAQERAAARADGIVSFTAVLSDDKRFALVELVAWDRKAFEEILKDTRPDMKRFDLQKGAARAEDIETEFRKYKKDFDFRKFREGK
jgi:hypothetical protein